MPYLLVCTITEKQIRMEQVSYNFSDKVVLITGGTSGIGLATAKLFAKSGAKLIMTGRQAKSDSAMALIGETSTRPLYVSTNQGDNDAVKALFERIRMEYGRLDIAVNNAANEMGIGKRLHEFEVDEYEAAVGANLRGVWLCMQQEIRQMLSQQPRGGAIVNISSVNGLGGVSSGSIYAAAKAGVIALAKSASQEVATQNIRINALAPGAHYTPLLQKALNMHSGGDEHKLDQVKRMYLAAIPQQRFGAPDEAAQAIAWLCSDAASYVNGHTMIIDGGMSSMMR